MCAYISNKKVDIWFYKMDDGTTIERYGRTLIPVSSLGIIDKVGFSTKEK